MPSITEDLIRKRAEHNNCELSTLEEVSLHQQDIEKIEYIDKWCKELKILYLQSNLIPKIENVKRLKKLEYLNLALNNIEKIENLEGCESLKKLDLTVNHVRELTSIESLKELAHFREMYLTGNPCTDFECYREYVVATLPQLQCLDGRDISKSERIAAIQNYIEIKRKIMDQQRIALKEREKQKADYAEKQRLKEEKKQRKGEIKKMPGFDGDWYTDINSHMRQDTAEEVEEVDSQEESEAEKQKREAEEEKAYWDEKSEFTPESRLEVHKHLQEQKRKENKEEEKPKRERRLFYDDGRAFNVNEAKVQFTLEEDEENHRYRLDLALWKHLDTSLVDADVQPNYVRVTIKGKIFQLHLDREVQPDSSTAQRSQTTGHLVITMPKAGEHIVVKRKEKKSESQRKETVEPMKESHDNGETPNRAFLEVGGGSMKAELANIVSESGGSRSAELGPVDAQLCKSTKQERPNSPDFVDDPDVPPLI